MPKYNPNDYKDDYYENDYGKRKKRKNYKTIITGKWAIQVSGCANLLYYGPYNWWFNFISA